MTWFQCLQGLGISTKGFRASDAQQPGKAASEASTPLPREPLDERLFQHDEVPYQGSWAC